MHIFRKRLTLLLIATTYILIVSSPGITQETKKLKTLQKKPRSKARPEKNIDVTEGASSSDVDIILFKVDLVEVSFSGLKYHVLTEDNGSAKYDAPHWQDNSSPLDGDADDTGDRNYPLCFTRNTQMVASAKFVITPSFAHSGNWKIRGDGPGDLDFPESTATLSGNELTVGSIKCTNSFENQIAFINPMTVTWEVSADGGNTWCSAGSSNNRVYITLNDPVPGTTLYETVVDIACRNADGKVTADDAVDGIWADFTGPIPGVKRKSIDGHNKKDGMDMRYWAEAGNPINDIISELCRSMQSMLTSSPTNPLLNGIGNCFAWSELFHNVLRSHGIHGSRIFEVRPKYMSPFRLSPDFETGLMLVKQWDFADSGNAPTECSPFTHLNSEITDQDGVEGQGNENPPGAFFNHYVLRHNGKYYDPSYGNGPFSGTTDDEAKNAWENFSIAGFVIGCNAENVVATKNDTSNLETNFFIHN